MYTGGEASDGLSKVNRAEVDAVAAVVQGLCAAGLSAAEIGVVSPYAAQVLHLPYISPSSPRYLPFISTASPLHLPDAAQVRLLRHRLRGGGGGGGGGGDPAAVEVSSVD